MPRCRAKARHGKLCGRAAMHGGRFCWGHDPGRRAERRKAAVGTGRPAQYARVDLAVVRKCADTGMTMSQLAAALSVDRATITRWLDEEAEFRATVDAGKAIADGRVEASLYARAVGYDAEDSYIFQHRGEAVTVPTVKHYPPEPRSQEFWLKNRAPETWREKQEMAVTTDGPVLIALPAVDTARLGLPEPPDEED